VSRRNQRAALLSQVDSVSRGEGGNTVVIGPPGIGRSHLLDDLAAHAARLGCDIIRLGAHESDEHLLFGAITTLVSQVGVTGVEDHHQSTLANLGDRGDSDANPLAVGAAVLALLATAASDNGTVLLIDDMQWIDAPSRQAILFAARRLGDDPLLTVMTSSDRSDAGLGFPTMTLLGLDLEEATVVLSSGQRCDEEVARRCWEFCDGNPLVLHELSRAIDDRHRRGAEPIPWHTIVPRRLADTVARRIAPLGDDVRTALLVLALCAPRWLDAGLEAHGVTRSALEPAETEGLVILDGRPRLAGSTFAAAVISSCPPSAVRAMHARLAQVIPDDDLAAWHLSAAADGPDAEASAALAATAARARSRGAPTAAAAAYERAAALAVSSDDARRWSVEAAHAWWFSARPDRAIELLEPLDVDDDTGLIAEVSLRLGTARGWWSTSHQSAIGMIDDAHRLADRDPAAATRVFVTGTAQAALAGDTALSAEAADAAVAAAHRTDDVVLHTVATAARGFATAITGRGGREHPDVEVLLSLKSLDLAALTDEQLDVAQLVGFGLMTVDRLSDAVTLFSDLRREARRRGTTTVMNFAAALLGECERRRGSWHLAERWSSDVRNDVALAPIIAAELGDAITARIWAYQGRAESSELAIGTIRAADSAELGFVSAFGRAAAVARCLTDGDLGAAHGWLEELQAQIRASGTVDPGVLWADLDHLEVLVRMDRRDELAALIRESERRAATTTSLWPMAIAELGTSILEALERPFTAPVRTSSPAPAALDRFSALAAPFETARARLLLVEYQVIHTDDRSAHLDAAIDTFARLGAEPWTARAQQLNRSLLTRSSIISEHGDTAEALTSAELRVGLTVAAGCSNAEAASELYLSQRTVEAHLRSIFRKLGVRNRTEMAARLRVLKAPPE
jgi:DNA-binding CsgD family transcriptional regulator